MAKTQLARGIWAGFAQTENPFSVPNGMEENLRTLDDHIAPYTLSAPVPASTVLPANVPNGAAQIFSDGSYAVRNSGVWRHYTATLGLLMVEINSKAKYLCTGLAWEKVEGGSADKTFLTRAVMDADTSQSVGTQGRVTNDPAHTSAAPINGNYTWMGAANGGWVWSGLQTLDMFRFFELTASIAEISEAEKSRIDRPNLISADKLSFDVMPVVVAGQASVEIFGGRKVLRLDSVGSGTQNINVYWRVPAHHFPSMFASACITFDFATSGTTGSISVVSRNANNVQLSVTSISSGVAGSISKETEFFLPSVSIHPDAAYVDLRIDLTSTIGSKYVCLRAMMLADGPDAGFRQPTAVVPIFSYFPNPSLSSQGASLYQADRILEDGEYVLSMTGPAIAQVWYDVQAVGTFGPGAMLELSADVLSDVSGTGSSVDVNIIFLSATGVAIGSLVTPAYTAAGAYQPQSVSYTVPSAAATVRFRFVKRAPASMAKVRRVILRSNAAQTKVLNVQPGEASAPVRLIVVKKGGDYPDIQSGVNAAKPFGTVIVSEGDYSPFSVTGFYGRIHARRGDRVRVLGGDVLTGINKTPGYANVYDAPLNAAPHRYLWEHDTPDAATLISAADRHTLQRGLTHRLPSTRIMPVGSIAAVDASSTPVFFYDAQSSKVFFRTSDGGPPGARQIRIPAVASTAHSCILGGSGDEIVEISGIEAMYGYNGFRLVGCASVRLLDCAAIANATDGLSLYDTPNVELVRPRAGGNGNDGTNGHALSASAHNTQLNYTVIDAWCHDNWDDGDSLHSRCVGSYQGGLYENNGSGIATAVGAHVTLLGGVVRRNGRYAGTGRTDPKDFGAGAIGAASDGGVGTQMLCVGTISEDNGVNFTSQGAGNTIDCVGTKSVRGRSYGYLGASGGEVIARDASDAESAVVKSGIVSVRNTLAINE